MTARKTFLFKHEYLEYAKSFTEEIEKEIVFCIVKYGVEQVKDYPAELVFSEYKKLNEIFDDIDREYEKYARRKRY